MKKIYLLYISLLACISTFSQSSIRMSDYWVDTYFINPASIDEYFSFLKLGASYRNQWFGIEGAPQTGMFSASMYFNNKGDRNGHSIGLNGTYDEIGYTKTINVGPTYAFSFDLVDYRDYYCLVGLGVSPRFQALFYDFEKIITDETVETMPMPYHFEENKQMINFDVGMETLFGKDGAWNCLVGFCVQNITSVFDENNTTPFANNYILYAQAKTDRYKNFNGGLYCDFSLGVAGILSQNVNSIGELTSDIYQMEYFGKFHWYINSENVVAVGPFGRNKREWRTLHDWGLLGEYEYKRKIKLSLTYEQNFSTIAEFSSWGGGGTVELALIYRLYPSVEKRDRNPNSRADKGCPDSFKYYQEF